MVKGKLRFQVLKDGGITASISIPPGNEQMDLQALVSMYGAEVVVSPVNATALAKKDEIHFARLALQGIDESLKLAESVLPLDMQKASEPGETEGHNMGNTGIGDE